MSLASVLSETEAQNKSIVMADAWGHLFPTSAKEGFIWLAVTEYRRIGTVILKEDIDIDGSPWWYETIHDFAYEFNKEDTYPTGSVLKISVVVTPIAVGDDCEEIQIVVKQIEKII